MTKLTLISLIASSAILSANSDVSIMPINDVTIQPVIEAPVTIQPVEPDFTIQPVGDMTDNVVDVAPEAVKPAPKGGKYYQTVEELVGSISFQDRAEYKAIGQDIKQNGTKEEMAQFFKKTIVAETSTVNAINYLNKNNAEFAKYAQQTGLFEKNGKIDKNHPLYIKMNDARIESYKKHVDGTTPGHLPDFIVRPINDMPIITPEPVEPNTPKEHKREIDPSNEEPISDGDPITEPSDPITPIEPISTKTELSAVAFNMTAAVWNNADDNIEIYTGVKAVSVSGRVNGIKGSDQYLQFVVGAEYQYEVAQDIDLTVGLEAQLGSDVSGVSPFVGVNYNITEDLKAYARIEALKVGMFGAEERVITPTFGITYKF